MKKLLVPAFALLMLIGVLATPALADTVNAQRCFVSDLQNAHVREVKVCVMVVDHGGLDGPLDRIRAQWGNVGGPGNPNGGQQIQIDYIRRWSTADPNHNANSNWCNGSLNGCNGGGNFNGDTRVLGAPYPWSGVDTDSSQARCWVHGEIRYRIFWDNLYGWSAWRVMNSLDYHAHAC